MNMNTPVGRQSSHAQTEEIRSLFRNYGNALINKSLDRLNELHADNFVGISLNGDEYDKQQSLIDANAELSKLNMQDATVRIQKVTFQSDDRTAFIHTRIRYSGTYENSTDYFESDSLVLFAIQKHNDNEWKINRREIIFQEIYFNGDLLIDDDGIEVISHAPIHALRQYCNDYENL